QLRQWTFRRVRFQKPENGRLRFLAVSRLSLDARQAQQVAQFEELFPGQSELPHFGVKAGEQPKGRFMVRIDLDRRLSLLERLAVASRLGERPRQDPIRAGAEGIELERTAGFGHQFRVASDRSEIVRVPPMREGVPRTQSHGALALPFSSREIP